MVMDLEKEKISINQTLGIEKEVFQVENDIIVNDIKPDVLSIIDTNGILCINKKEIIDGKIKIEGEINTYIIYLADDESNSVRCLNTCLDFNQLIDLKNYNNEMDYNICCKLKDIGSKIINGRKVKLKATIEAQIRSYQDMNLEIINNLDSVENMQVLKTTEQVISCLGKGKTKVNAKDNISINVEDDIAEIMRVDFNVIDKEIKTSYNKILVKADADVAILYITEDNRVNSVEARIPIMGFVDMQNISEDSICTVSDQINNIIVKPNIGDEHSINVEAEIEFDIEAYQNKQIDIVDDLYSTDRDTMFNQKIVNALTAKENIKERCDISESVQNPDLEDATICSMNIEPNIIKEDIRMGKVIYEGEVLVKILYIKNEKMNINIVNIPFNFEILSNKITPKSNIIRDIDVKNDSIIIKNDRVDINMCLEFNIIVEECKEIRLIEEISMDENTQKDKYSMVIYFVKPGDTLWKIAKKFKSTVSDIARLNEIENENKIFQGEQLYIPRPISNNG